MSTGTRAQTLTATRKSKHLEICTDPDSFEVEGGRTALEGVHFLHAALPELSTDDVDASTEFLGRRVSMPVFISCMTGGSSGARKVNHELARAAQESGIAVGMGSIRILFEQPELFDHFHLRPLAPDVPILANLSAVQLRDLEAGKVGSLLEKLEVDALAVHLNPGQELVQPEGDRDFRGLAPAISAFAEDSPVPLIVKETGAGIRPSDVRRLFELGARYVDVAGAGGTNWMTVEGYRLAADERELSRELVDWGMPTGLILGALGTGMRNLIASGGIRSGLDAARALALGADLVGMALPFARAAVAAGRDGVLELAGAVNSVLSAVMVLTASRRLSELREAKVWMEPGLAAEIAAFREADRAFGRLTQPD